VNVRDGQALQGWTAGGRQHGSLREILLESCMRRLEKIGELYARLGRLSQDAADENMLAIHVSLDADRSCERCH
jgi:hypothetical protein